MYMDEKFGAWQVDDDPNSGAAEFKLFFPDRAIDPSQYLPQPGDGRPVADYGDPKIKSIQVVGNFQRHLAQKTWDFEAAPQLIKQPHPKGWVWTYQTPQKLPAGFYEYKYRVTFEDGTDRIVSDPCARYGGVENQNAGFTIGSTTAAMTIQPVAGGRKPLRDCVVYELMIDDFTGEYREARAPLDAVRDQLDYLKDQVGINAILFMPWTAWPGDKFNWGYTPYLYFSVEYRYANALGQPSEKLGWLRRLIDDCHARGIHVIMDGVFNHVGDISVQKDIAGGFPYHWLYQNPEACPYVGQFGGTFPGLLDLDYHNGCTQEFIRDVCLYWIDFFKIDGIRFDNTVNFYIEGDSRGLPQLMRDINQHMTDQGEPNFALTIEHIDLNAAYVVNTTGATSYWNNALYQIGFEYLWSGHIDARIMSAFNNHTGLNDDKVATMYLSNHDHSHVGWQAGARDNAGALKWYRTQPYLIALLTMPGTPMIQNGQEFAEDYWLMEDDQGSGRRVVPRPLHWDFVNDGIGSKLLAIYHKLITIRKTHPALRSNNFYPQWEDWMTDFNQYGYGVNGEKQIVIFHRWGNTDDGQLERFMVVINFSNQDQVVDIPFADNGVWHDLLNDHDDQVNDYRLANQTIGAYWGRVYCQ